MSTEERRRERERGEGAPHICYHDLGECANPNEGHHLERQEKMHNAEVDSEMGERVCKLDAFTNCHKGMGRLQPENLLVSHVVKNR